MVHPRYGSECGATSRTLPPSTSGCDRVDGASVTTLRPTCSPAPTNEVGSLAEKLLLASSEDSGASLRPIGTAQSDYARTAPKMMHRPVNVRQSGILSSASAFCTAH